MSDINVEAALANARLEIDRARQVSRWVRVMGIITTALGGVAIVIAIARYYLSVDPLESALEFLAVVGIASIASGLALVSTSWNQRMAASRLELELVKARESGLGTH